MKRLISAEDVYKAISLHQDIHIDGNTLVTAQARDIAKEHGVCIFDTTINTTKDGDMFIPCNKEVRCCGKTTKCDKDVRCCQSHNDNDKSQECIGTCEKALSADEIYKVLCLAIESGIISESDLDKIL